MRLRRELKAIRAQYREDQRQIRTAERSAWATLKRDARDNNLAAVRESLLTWARAYWPQDSVHSLSAVARLGQRPGLEAQVRALDASLFGDHRDTDFDPELLLREVDALRTRKKQ